MKVALLNSPLVFLNEHVFKPSTTFLGISNLDGYLSANHVQTKYIDLNLILMDNEKLSFEYNKTECKLDTNQYIQRYKELITSTVDLLVSSINIQDCEFICISIIDVHSLKIMIPFIHTCKQKYPQKKIIVGGFVNQSFEDRLLKEGIIDFLVFGQGEKPLLDIIQEKDPQKIPGIGYYDGKNVNYNPPSTKSSYGLSIQRTRYNLSDIMRQQILNNKYNLCNDIFFSPILPYKMSDGCQYNCTFCGTQSNTVKHKTPKKIVSDLKELVEIYRYKYFYFLNQHFSISKSFVEEFCDRIIESNLKIYWCDCFKPLSFLSQALYYKLRKSGLVRATYGIETGSPKIMKLMRKGHSVKDCENNLAYAHKAGIWTEVSFIIGFPGETDIEFKETLDFIKRNKKNIDTLTWCTFRLGSTSYIYKNPEEFNIRIAKSFVANEFTSLAEYDEIGGPSFEEIQKNNVLKDQQLVRLGAELTGEFICEPTSRFIIFPLFETLKQKSKVREFIGENKDIIERIHKAYHSIFTGTLSNQHIPGNVRVSEYELISLDEIICQMKNILSWGYDKLLLVGGEPLLRDDIIELLKVAKQMGFNKIMAKTNARMLENKSFCATIAEYLDEILIINPSEKEEEYDKISKVKGSFSESNEGIQNWASLGKKIRNSKKEIVDIDSPQKLLPEDMPTFYGF